MRRLLAGLAAVAIALSAAPSFAQEKLTVWWVKGFYKSEDDALYAAIKKYLHKRRRKHDPSQYAGQDMIPSRLAALACGAVAFIGSASTHEAPVLGKWAYDGKLED